MKEKYKKIYIEALKLYQDLSTCARLHVSAMLVKDGRILSVGYNGTPAGCPHCNEKFIKIGGRYYIGHYGPPSDMEKYEVSEEEWYTEHHRFSEHNEVHAEMNVICFALKNNINITECDLITSIAPCLNCAKLILSCGIKHVYYLDLYDRSNEGIIFLKEHNVNIEKI